jgi:low temperature requirement protein LtrA
VHRAGQVLPDAVVASRHPAWVGRSAADSHLVMVTGVITTAVGYGVAIAKPIEHAPAAWTAVILGGPAVYLVGRSRLEYEVFSRVSLFRPVALGVLALLLPALLRAAPLITLTAAGAVLAGVASTDAWRARGKPSEGPAPPM